MIYGVRDGCPADRHDAVRARRHHGCVCPRSLELDRERRDRYNATPHGRAALARKRVWDSERKRLDSEIIRFFRDERLDSVRRMTLAGVSASVIARDLRITSRTVQRIRARLRTQGRLPALPASSPTQLTSGLESPRIRV